MTIKRRNKIQKTDVSRTAKKQSPASGLKSGMDRVDRKDEVFLNPEGMTRLMLENANDAIYINQDQYLQYVNAKTIEITGYTEEELLTRPGMEFIHPDDRDVIYDRYVRRFRGEIIRSVYPHRIVCKNGDVKWIEVNTVMISWQGRPAALSFMKDITEKKKAEEALKQSERELAQIIDFLPDATFAININGEVIAWNRAIEDLTGIVSRDILGKGNYEYARAFYGERNPILIDRVLHPSIAVAEEYLFYANEKDSLLAETQISKNGKTIFFWCKASPIYDHRETVTGAIESLRDISALKKTEEELKAKTRSLEEMNTALKVLLNQRQNDSREIEEKLLLNIKELVLPHIDTLKSANLDFTLSAHLDIIENNLKEIFSPFLMNITAKYSNFTAREIQVVCLIRDGMCTKEIARALNISTNSVDTYRQTIRKKLGLNKKKGNIRSLLLSLDRH